jgi:hypothetical protein
MKDIFLDKIIHYSLVVAAVVLSLVSASQAETSFPASSCEVIPVAATTWKSDFTDLVASNGQADLSDLPPNFNGLIEVQVSGSTVIMMAVTIQDSRIINLLSGEDITSSFQHGGWVILNDGLFSTDIDIDQALIDTINNEIGVEGFEELVDLAGVDNALVFIQDDWSGIMSDREALSWVLDTLGRDNLVSFMHGDPSDFLQLLSAVNTLGRDDFVRLIGIVGQETLLSAASAGNTYRRSCR